MLWALKTFFVVIFLLLGLGASTAKAATITKELNKAALSGIIKVDDQQEIITNYLSLKKMPDKDFKVMAATYDDLAKKGLLARRAVLMQSALSVFVRYGDKPVGTRVKLPGSIVVARVAGAGWQVHPLASAGRLNSLALTSKSAVAASAFARLYSRTGDQRWRRAALSSLKPMLSPPLRGTTIKGQAGDNSLLYPSSPKMLVANAQLWATVSAGEVATLTGDPGAQLLFDRLVAQSLFELPFYASGTNWTLYQIGGKPASKEYHYLTVQALRRLCKTRTEFCSFADRFGQEVPLSVQSLGLFDL